MKTPPTLPGGTVTFLFTDIEGSTRLLQNLGDEYAALLSDHRRILRAAFENHGGREVDTQGDSFFVSFARAHDALEAVVQTQRALADHKWPQGVEVRVRMGLHTGEPQVAEEGYLGLDVHRAARLAHAGRGGQVLLSPSTVALLAPDLPEGIRLRDLGEHRLKDLAQPVRVHQLEIAGLPVDFPPLASLDARPNNLPAQLTSFVGRRAEIEAVQNLLEEGRLVTLLGPGGVGKSRLSLQMAANLVDQFPQGVWFVELASISAPEQIAPAIAAALRFTIDVHSSDLDPRRQLIDFLGSRSLLMILDNFEHVVDGAALVTDILENAPQVRVLVTSRERLNVREEWVYPVGGLALSLEADRDHSGQGSALELFWERARQEKPDLTLTGEEREAAVRICRLVEGMPLGIELAAAWVSVLSCCEIAEEVQKNLDFLTTSMRGVPDKHRSLRAVFETSWRLISQPDRGGFRRLSLFRGSFTQEAASEVADVSLPMLLGLMQKSLVRRNEQGRFEIHEVLRQYAYESLGAEQENYKAVHESYSRYFFGYLEKLIVLVNGDDHQAAREAFRRDMGNIQEAVFWALDQWDLEKTRVFLFGLHGIFWEINIHEGMDIFKGMVRHLEADTANGRQPGTRQALLNVALVYQTSYMSDLGAPDTEKICLEILGPLRGGGLNIEQGICLRSLGICAVYRGAYREAIEYLKEALPLVKPAADHFGVTSVLLWLGWAHNELGEFDSAYSCYSEAYEICMDHQVRNGLAYTLSKLGTLADVRGAYSEALSYHQKALETFRELEDQAGQGYALSRMCLSAWGLGEYEVAKRYGMDGYENFADISHRWGIATSLSRIGFAELGLGNLDAAREVFHQGMNLALAFKYRHTAIYALIGLAGVQARQGDKPGAIEMLVVAISDPVTPAQYRMIGQMELDKIRDHTPAEVFAAARAAGERAVFDDVVARIRKPEITCADPRVTGLRV